MQHKNRWLAAMLSLVIALGDCGGITALAEEPSAAETTADSSISENDAPFPQNTEMPPALPDENSHDAVITESETDAAKEADAAVLPALHMGQIKKGETLPAPNDPLLSYDLPISFDSSDSLLLFTSYSIDSVWDAKNGAILWSILRGEKGQTPGTPALLREEDDWTEFETVSDSPWFRLSTGKDAVDISSETAELTANDIAPESALPSDRADEADGYDYYIRASYYTTAAPQENEAFYAAVTLPFLPREDAFSETDRTAEKENETETETISENDSSNEITISENTTEDEIKSTEETLPEETQNTDSTPKNDAGPDSAGTDASPAVTEESSVSSNSVTALADETNAVSNNALEQEPQEKTNESIGILTLNADSVTLHSDEVFSVTAAIEPNDTSDIPSEITWKSSDETVATVAVAAESEDLSAGGEASASDSALASHKAKITAVGEGTVEITAECGDRKASVHVTVVSRDDNEVYDLSGDLWVDGFQRESDTLVYTGQKITQNFRVYHKETLLKEKTDYTLSYKNNVNAAAWNSAKAPCVTITLKGQYSGSITLYFTINPRDISKIDPHPSNAVSPGYEQIVNYAKTLTLPAPALTLNKKKLAAGKDFTCDYTTPGEDFTAMPETPKKGDAYDQGTTYSYTVRGKGNFTGSFPMRLVVVKKAYNFNTATVTLNQKKYDYHGVPLTKADVTINQIKFGKTPLDPSLYDYTVFADIPQDAYITVYPSDLGKEAGYRGSKKVTLKLEADRNIRNANLRNWQDTIPFSQKALNEEGGMYQNMSLTYITDAETGTTDLLSENTDYTVKYSNAKKVGKVTVTFTGKGRYKGTFTKTYKITPNTSKNHFSIRWKNVTRKDGDLFIAYQKGGAKPDFILLDQDQNTLKRNTDYTIAYKNNNIKKNEETSEMTLTITGKGNYNGYKETINLTVVRANLADATLTVADKPLAKKKDFWKSAVTITDANGKKLEAKKDYLTPVTYSYPDMENGQPQAETVITVTVTGCGSYQGEITGSYKIFNGKNNINNWKVVIDPQIYTGKAVTLSAEKIHVYKNDKDKKNKVNELPSTCYEIVGYKNNIKTGNAAKVTLHGLGEYGGTKTYSFKIQKKPYVKNSVKKIALDQKNLSLTLADALGKPEAGVLSATITAQTKEKIVNPTIIWTTSNSKVAEIEVLAEGIGGYDSSGEAATSTSRIHLKVKKEGKVTITAISQDGNKKAQCTVTITNKPVFEEAGKQVKANIGETYQLHLTYAQTESTAANAVAKWSSSNSEAVSVDSNGLLTMKKAGVAIIKVSVAKYNFTKQCYAIAIDPNEPVPEGKVCVYEQQPDCKDDTPHINKLLRDWEYNPSKYDCMYIPAGVYHIDATGGGFGGIVLTSNQKLVMSSSTVLEALANNQKESQVIWAFGRDNVTISGGQIIGERRIHKGSGGEGGHGIRISGCTNVTIENVDVSQCWGDGIWLGLYEGWEDGTGKRKNFYTNGVTITNCNSHNNRRSNLSITDASNVTVENCDFNHAGGTSPECGINIEPHKEGYTCRNVKISNSRFKGNGRSIQILGQLNCHIDGVTIENCKGDKAPVKWQGYGGSYKGVTEKNNNWNWK